MLHAKTNQVVKFSPEPNKKEGVYLDDLVGGTVLDIETQHHHYRLIKGANTHARISGHPRYCPQALDVEIEGSLGGGPPVTPNPGFIGRGMHLIYKHPVFGEVTTSRIREIRKVG